jgi:type I restriction enzyme S subunit
MTTSTSVNGSVRKWRRYPAYRKTDVQWLDEIPYHWNPVRLKFVVSKIGSGKTPKGGGEIYPESGVLFLRSQNVHFEGIRLEDVAYIDEATDLEMHSTRVRCNDVLLNITGASLGRCALVGPNMPAANVNQHVCILRPVTPKIIPGFLNACLASRPVQAQIFSSENGVSREGLNYTQTANLFFALPSDLGEQKHIVAFIDRQTSMIDALMVKKERLIELLQEKRTALISHAVTQGLDPSVPMKDSGVKWLGEIPAHWTPKKIKYLFRFAKRQNHPGLTVLSVYRDYGVIEKTTRDDNHNRTPEDLTTYQLVNVGDLVINKMKAWQGSLGVSSLHGITSPDYVVYKSTNKEHLPYLHHRLRVPGMAAVFHSISNGIRPDQWRLEPEKFEQLWLFLPPVEEQKAICQYIDRQVRSIDELGNKVHDGIEKLREYRTALISAAVTGKIDVRQEVV